MAAIPQGFDGRHPIRPAFDMNQETQIEDDENVEYARRLEDAGVACDIEIFSGAFHGFDIVAPTAGVSRAFFDRQCEALRKALSS